MSTSGDITTLRIERIRRDGATQLRTQIDEAHVQRLIEALENGATLPPITVYRDDDGVHWLADGWHRLRAHQALNRVEITAEVRSGSRRDAILHAACANAGHGLPRSRADVRRAIEALLRDEEWRQWSDREIARRVGCSPTTVGTVRREIESSVQFGQMTERRAERNGVVYTVSAPVQDPARAAEAALQRAQNAGPATGERWRLLLEAEQAIARVTDEQERQDLDARLALLWGETHEARRRDDDERLERARAALEQAEEAIDRLDLDEADTHLRDAWDALIGVRERGRADELDVRRRALETRHAQALYERGKQRNEDEGYLARARELVHLAETAGDLDARITELQIRTEQDPPRPTPAPGERPEVADIRRRATALGYRCTLTGPPGDDRILIWRDGERIEDLDGLTLDEARDWLRWTEELQEDRKIWAWHDQVARMLRDCDPRLLSVLAIVITQGVVDRQAIARAIVDAAAQRNPDRLAMILEEEYVS